MRKVRVGQCGGCEPEVRFWAVERAKVTCVKCGLTHEVECDEMLDLTTGERTQVVMLVMAVGQPENETGRTTRALTEDAERIELRDGPRRGSTGRSTANCSAKKKEKAEEG